MARYPSVKVAFHTDKFAARVSDEVVKPFLELVGVEYTNDVKRLMKTSPATGRTYKRGSKVHRASAPGEPPKPDTGDLVKSVRWQYRRRGSRHVMEVGSTKKKALYLEYGAAKLSKPPRPASVRARRQTGREAKWILFPRPAWGPAGRRIRRRMPELMRRASRLRRR